MFDNIICCGDFSDDALQFNSPAYNLFQNILNSYGLTQFVNKRKVTQSSAKLLDSCLCSDDVNVTNCDVI